MTPCCFCVWQLCTVWLGVSQHQRCLSSSPQSWPGLQASPSIPSVPLEVQFCYHQTIFFQKKHNISSSVVFFSQDDPTLPFTDEIFWSRKAHLNFVRHIGLEKRVAKMGKTVRSGGFALIGFYSWHFGVFQNREMFSTYVVASGLQYGMGEHLFHYFFKVWRLSSFSNHVCDYSWMTQLPVFWWRCKKSFLPRPRMCL